MKFLSNILIKAGLVVEGSTDLYAAAAVVDTDKFVVLDGNTIKYRTGAEVLSDIGGVSGTGSAGQVSYWTGSTTQGGSNSLFWDTTNLRLGIGTNIPAARLHVLGSIITANSTFIYSSIDGNTDGNLYITANAGTANTTSSSIIFRSSLSGAAITERMRVTALGNLHVGTFFSDSGHKLQVSGTAIVSSFLNVGSDVATASVIKNFSADGSLVYAGSSFNNSSLPTRTIIISSAGTYSGLTGGSNLFVGRNAGSSVTTGTSNVFIGKSAGAGITTGGSNVMVVSSDATNLPSALANSIHIVGGNGYRSNDASTIPSATHAFIGGGFNTGAAVKDFYFGQMPFTADAGSGLVNIVFYAPSGSGTDIGGSNFTIAAGRGTGTGTPGDFIIQTSTATTTGTTLQTLTTRLRVAGGTGVVTMSNLSGTGTRMVVADDNGVLSTQSLGAGAITGTGTAGQVAYFTGATTQAGSNNLFWDNTNAKLGIGTASPQQGLSIIRNENTSSGIETQNTSTGAAANSGIIVRNSSSSGQLFKLSTGYTTYKTLVANDLGFYNGTSGDISLLNDVAAGKIKFLTGTASVAQMTLTANGRLLLGSTTEGTQILQVTGTSLLNGNTQFGGFLSNTSAGSPLEVRANVAATTSFAVYYSSALSAVSGTYNILTTSGQQFTPTSGTAVFNSFVSNVTINQTGGANGITRGLYINPTLTAAADWRSIEWSNNSGWGLYGAGTANNYMAGSLGIGSTSLTGFNLRVSKNITGGINGFAISQEGVVQTDVTASVNGFYNVLNTQAAAFTLPLYRHFIAVQGTIGAGSSITTQYGFFANSSLTGATNNYGFFGEIPSGTGRWNLYMQGSADNFINGNLQLGSVTAFASAEKLQLTGDARIKTSAIGGLILEATSGTETPNVIFLSTTNRYNIDNSSGVLRFFRENTDGSAGAVRMSLTDGGNLLIGSTTDSGQRLQVVGTTLLSDTLRVNGNVAIGATPLADVNFYIRKTLSGSIFPTAVYADSTVTSTSTAGAVYFLTVPSTENATFTLPNLYHFRATQGTFGASSTVTNQFGYFVDSTLTGATNDFGFYGNLAAGTNIWNLYMNGTANNYLAGGTGIGTTNITAISGYTTLAVGNATNGGNIDLMTGATRVASWNNTATETYFGTRSNTPLAFTTNATEVGRFFANGNFRVGGNAADGGFRLDVTGTSRITDTLSLKNGTTSSLAINFTLATTTGIYANDDGVGTNLKLQASGQDNQLVLFRNSNIGVGTATPLTKFHIRTGNAASTLEGLRLANGSNDPNAGNRLSFFFSDGASNIGGAFIDVVKNGSDGNMIFSTSALNGTPTEKVRIFGDGNVGINTGSTNSGEKLQVTGTMKVTGATTITNATLPSFKVNHTAAGHASGWFDTNEFGVLISSASTSASHYLTNMTSGGTSRFRVNCDGGVIMSGNLTVDTNTLFVDATNNRVGIGTVSPTVTLDVNGTAKTTILHSPSFKNPADTVNGKMDFFVVGAPGDTAYQKLSILAGGSPYSTVLQTSGDGGGSRGFTLSASGPGGEMYFNTSDAQRWLISGGFNALGTGHLLPSTNNSYDIGASTLRAATIYGFKGSFSTNVIINSATDTGESLQVTGDVKITGDLLLTGSVNTITNGDFSSNFGRTYAPTATINNTNSYGLVSNLVYDLASATYTGSETYNAASNFVQTSIQGNATTKATQPFRGVLATIVGVAGGSVMNISDFRYFDVKSPDRANLTGHVVDNMYGLKIAAMVGTTGFTVTNGWGVYQEGASDNNYFNGKVLIGTSSAGSSKLRVSGLPTSAAGLSAGDIWNDSGTLKIA